MDSSSGVRDPLELLADEFLDRRRRGEVPNIEEYVGQYPQLADEIREVFPALEVMEEADPGTTELTTASADTVSEGRAPKLDRVGDYRVLREIGRGAMGVVYEAEQQSLGRRVALKVLPRRFAGDEKAFARFRREARAAARLHHTNIVPVFEVGQDGETAFYAMQMISGHSLDQVLVELRRLRQESVTDQINGSANGEVRATALSLYRDLPTTQPEVDSDSTEKSKESAIGDNASDDHAAGDQPSSSELSVPLLSDSDLSSVVRRRELYFRSVARIGEQVASALSYAHQHGTVHRDIKPSNLLLDTSATVWVADFGLAKFEEDGHTRTGDIVGTLRYMAPERFRGVSDPRSDVYSLGVTLYELLLLRPAFSASDQLRLIDDITNSHLPKPRAIEPQIPRDLETIVLKAIEKDPSRRYQSGDEIAEDLRRFLNDEPIKARRISPAEQFLRWSRRNKAIATLMIAVTLLIAATAVVSTVSAVQQANLRRQAERLQKQLERHLYMADMNRVQAAYEDGNISLMVRLLEKYLAADKEGLREFEWYYWWRVAHCHKRLLLRIDWGAGAFAVKPDDKTVVSVRSSEKTHRSEFALCDYRQTEPTTTVAFEYNARIKGLVFLKDGSVLIGTGGDGRIHRWETRGWKALEPLEPPGVKQLESDPSFTYNLLATALYKNDFQLVAVGTVDNRVILWRADNWEIIGDFPTRGQVRAVAVSPDGSKLAVATGGRGTYASVGGESEGAILFWDIASQQEITCQQPHRYAALDVAFSPDGKWFASGGADRRVVLWNAVTLEPVRTFDSSGAVRSVAFSKDSRLLAAGTVGENSVQLWDIESHTLMAVARGHNREVDAISFPDDTGEMLSGGRDGRLIAWNLRGLLEGDVLRGRFYRATYTLNGRQILAAAADGEIWTIDAQTGLRNGSWNEGMKHQIVAFSEDGGVVASIDFQGCLRTWRSSDHQLICEVDIDDMSELSTPVRRGQEFRYGIEGSFPAAVSRDGTMFALPAKKSDVPGIVLFDMKKGDERFLKTKIRPAHAIAFSPKGDALISVFLDGWYLWSLESDDPMPETLPSSGEPPGGAFSSNRDDPLMALAYFPNGINLVDSRTRKLIRPFLGHSGRVWCLAFSPDNKTVVSGATDSTLRLWDVDTGQLRSTLKGHLGPVLDVAFAPDGRSFVTCAADRTLRIWWTATEEEVRQQNVAWALGG